MSQIDYINKIIENLLKTENHIRGLAKAIGTNQTTIARKVNELNKMNVVDFKIIGKNKVVYLKKTLEAKQIVFNVENSRLVNIIDKYPALRIIVEGITAIKGVNVAILFGSYAKGIAKKESDIDIYVDTQNRKLKETIEKIDSKICVKIGKYNQDSLLIKEIQKNHVIIKGVEKYYEKNKFFD